jgi:enamine deaminase RidA (YjgF/YER057c/UK114 family)
MRAAGGELEDLIRTTVYLTDMREIGAVREARDRIEWKVPPATTVVEVSHLIDPGLRAVIDAIGAIRDE